MTNLRQVQNDVVANGRVEGEHLDVLRNELFVGGKIDRQAANILVELHKRVEHLTPDFERFYYSALKSHVLERGKIDAEMTEWLRAILSSDSWIRDEERKLLHELKGEATGVGPEFESFFHECMRRPQNKHTSG